MLVSAVDDAASGGEWIPGPVRLGPGEEGEALVTLTPLGFGRWAKVLTVASNDPGRPKTRLSLSATVRSRFLVEPRVFSLGELTAGTDTLLVATVAPRPPQALRLLAAAINPAPGADPGEEAARSGAPAGRGEASLAVRLLPPPAAAAVDSGAWRVEIRLLPEAAPGPLNERVVLSTDDPQVPAIELAVLGELLPGLACPARLEIDARYHGIGASGSLEIRRRSGPPFRITALHLEDPYLRAELSTLTPGEVYAITVTVPPDMPAGVYRPWLRVETDRPDQPLLRIQTEVRIGQPGRGGGRAPGAGDY
ncbi:hypothetical protein FJ251_09020 [bacterium]|nr:hypothetical protein [bacterium]